MAIDWDRVKEKNIILFYPGQSSWEWVLTDHSASKSVKKGTDCLECHEDEEQEMGGGFWFLEKKWNPILKKESLVLSS